MQRAPIEIGRLNATLDGRNKNHIRFYCVNVENQSGNLNSDLKEEEEEKKDAETHVFYVLNVAAAMTIKIHRKIIKQQMGNNNSPTSRKP